MVGVAIGTTTDPDETSTASAAGPEASTEDVDDEGQVTSTTGAPTTTRPPRTTTTRPTRTTTTRPTTTTTRPPDEGTRENPFAMGTPLITNRGLEVTVNGVDPEAAGAIAAANRFNDPAPDGMRFVMVNLAVTNSGDEPITPWLAVRVNAIGSRNQVHERCRGVLPDSLNDAPQLYPGGSASGNVCVVVPEEELMDGSLLIMVGPSFGDPVFIRP
jgi:hypothetical protein